jgi:ABC-2 type transport system ATP-binding protein
VIIETEGLCKQYGDFSALKNCELKVPKGEIFGLLGPNGAGKTTLIRLLMGFLQPTAGWAKVAGIDCTHNPVEVRRRVAYMPGETRLFKGMRGKDLLTFFSEIRNDKNVAAAIQIAQRLELDLSRRVAMMSTGMRQKLALSATLSASTDVIILDEPTSNLDPTVRGTVLSLVAEAKRLGKTVMFSSHVLSEVEEVCDRVVIMRAGELVHEQPMQELRKQHRIVATLAGEMPAAPAELNVHIEQVGDRVVIFSPADLKPILGWLSTMPLEEVQIAPVGLRAIYEQFHTPEGVVNK